MKVLFVHPGSLLYSEIFLKLEPLGLEMVATAAKRAGHDVRLLDLQIFGHKDLFRELRDFRPDAVGFSLNYLANVPEVLDLSSAIKRFRPSCCVFVGGHSASFISRELLDHSGGTIDCVVRGEGETIINRLLAALPDMAFDGLPGLVTRRVSGPCPDLSESLDELPPDRSLLRKERRYFIGAMDPCASAEFSRGCPWDCSFCSAWTFYGRKYRTFSPESVVEKLARIREPNIFVVDDVAFINPRDGFAIGELVERKGIRKRYYMETRADVLIRNKEVFAYWKKLGLRHMFMGLEALDEDGLRLFRKRTTSDKNSAALEIARELDVTVSLNIIADPGWDRDRFEKVRQWALRVPEIVHVSIMTPYPGTESWITESRSLATRDYRLFDIQHAVLPTRLPLLDFYKELVKTQDVLNRKHLGFTALRQTFFKALGLLSHGQTNFLRMLWKFNKTYNPERQYADHFREPRYLLPSPTPGRKPVRSELFVHGRPLDQGREKAAE